MPAVVREHVGVDLSAFFRDDRVSPPVIGGAVPPGRSGGRSPKNPRPSHFVVVAAYGGVSNGPDSAGTTQA
jgi:hypothetical protein